MRAEATHGVPLPSASRDVGEAVSDRAGARGARRRTLGIWGRPRPVRARHFIGRPVKMARDFLKFIEEGAAPGIVRAQTSARSEGHFPPMGIRRQEPILSGAFAVRA